MTLPRACRSLISPVVTETERQKKAKELPAQSSSSALLLCVPLAFFLRSGWPWSEQLQAAVCTVSSNPSIPLGGKGVEGEMVALCGGLEKGIRCAVGALQKADGREKKRESTLVLFCNEREEKG